MVYIMWEGKGESCNTINSTLKAIYFGHMDRNLQEIDTFSSDLENYCVPAFR